ncbi:MAG: hypothetical protein U0531_11055 [Dehalococcoidia bacterium]
MILPLPAPIERAASTYRFSFAVSVEHAEPGVERDCDADGDHEVGQVRAQHRDDGQRQQDAGAAIITSMMRMMMLSTGSPK